MRLTDFYEKTDKGFAHNTLVIYEMLLRNRNIKNILEVGVLNGESIRMWASVYSDSDIFGVDIIDTSSLQYEFDNVNILVGDAYTTKVVEDLSNVKYDLIIDDGPHTLSSQCFAAANFPELLTNDGLLVIEDIGSIGEAHTIQTHLKTEYLNSSFIIDRRGAPCDFDYNRFNERNEILLVLDRSIR